MIKLPPNLVSMADLNELIFEVRKYAKWYGQAAIKQRLHPEAQLQVPAVSEGAATMLHDWFKAKPVDQPGLDKLLEELEAYKSNAPQVAITLAALPSERLKRSLSEWCRQNIAPNVLVDFAFNATILGGMVVRYGSHIHDWSFRRQILAARAQFPEVLRRV